MASEPLAARLARFGLSGNIKVGAEPAPEPTLHAVSLALHRMTCEDNPGHADWTDCPYRAGCYDEAVRLIDQLERLGWTVARHG